MELRKFAGREIGPAIVEAIEAVRRDQEIVTFKAGENMPITAGLATDENDGFIPEYAWTGEKWEEIGDL